MEEDQEARIGQLSFVPLGKIDFTLEHARQTGKTSLVG